MLDTMEVLGKSMTPALQVEVRLEEHIDGPFTLVICLEFIFRPTGS